MSNQYTIQKIGSVKFLNSPNYKYAFNLNTGYFMRWGATLQDDPVISPFGPEICDIEISTICRQGCSFCFPSNTKIQTLEGKKPIEDIKYGDKVYGFNEETQTKEIQVVDQLFEREYEENIIRILLEDDTYLFLTPNHRIYTQRGWVKASEIRIDDEVLEYSEKRK